MNKTIPMTAVLVLLLSFCGCTRWVVRMSPPLLDNTIRSIFEECDPELAQAAVPSTLKILEGLLKSDPVNVHLLRALSMGYAGFALLFVEGESPERASDLYLRARNYGLASLGSVGSLLADPGASRPSVEGALLRLGQGDVDRLFWAAFSWNAWVNLNLDRPEGLAELSTSQACLERVLALDRSHFHGLPLILQGTVLAARPPALGGDYTKARPFFEEAIALGRGKFFPAQYYAARYYAVGIQDRHLFQSLIGEIMSGAPDAIRGMCLVNTVFQEKAERLLTQDEELFY